MALVFTRLAHIAGFRCMRTEACVFLTLPHRALVKSTMCIDAKSELFALLVQNSGNRSRAVVQVLLSMVSISEPNQRPQVEQQQPAIMSCYRAQELSTHGVTFFSQKPALPCSRAPVCHEINHEVSVLFHRENSGMHVRRPRCNDRICQIPCMSR